MKPDKEKWIEEVMSSADGLARASSQSVVDEVMACAKENWIDGVIDSTSGMYRAETPDISETVLNRTGKSERHVISRASSAAVWRIAASVIFFLTLNTVAIFSYRGRMAEQAQHMAMQQTASEFGLGQNPGSDPGTLIFGN